MMLPNQITMHNFTQTAKGGYKAIEVDAYLQRVSQSYNKLYNDNKELNEKLNAIMPQIDEYNQRKATIAEAMIWAKSTAEKNIEEAKGIAENLVADATVKADKLLEDTKAQADAYYADKTVTANRNVEKAKSELENIRQQSEIYAERYISEINVKTQTIIEDANAKAASIVSAAYSDAKKAREKADRIIADANAELLILKNEALKIKEQMTALISYAQAASAEIDESAFAVIKNEVTDAGEILEAKSVNIDEIDKFSFEGIEEISLDEEESSETASEEEKPSSQPDYVRFFGADIPDVNDILSGIFSVVNDNSSSDDQEENSFRFEKVVSDFDKPEERKPFDFLKKDSE